MMIISFITMLNIKNVGMAWWWQKWIKSELTDGY